MELIHAAILGIIEGLTEFIPVSSTAHLLLAGQALGIPSQALLVTLSISIQAAAILAVILHFWGTIWRRTGLFWKIALAFLPTAAAGILLYPALKPLFANTAVIALALIIGGVLLILIRPVDRDEEVSNISWKNAFLIGLVQIASFIPGVSRAGATLIGGTFLRIPRSVIVPFSFLLAIPTIMGASAVSLADLPAVEGAWLLIGIAALVSFATALATIRLFLRILVTKPLAWFGWYRIAVGVLVLVFA